MVHVLVRAAVGQTTISLRLTPTALHGVSQITMHMNGRCRNPTTGRVDHTKPGAEEEARRDRIDSKAIQWMGSVLHAHSDTECIANATAWPHGPGGWGFLDTDAHTILISPPRWDPDNTTVLEEDRIRARRLYQHQCRRKHVAPCLPRTNETGWCRSSRNGDGRC